MRTPAVRHLLTAVSTTALAFGVVACGASSSEDPRAAGSAEGTLVIYSGRNEKLVGPLLDQLRKAVGQKVEIRYVDSSELAAQPLEEGDRTNDAVVRPELEDGRHTAVSARCQGRRPGIETVVGVQVAGAVTFFASSGAADR